VGEADTFLKTDDLTRPIWPPREFVFKGIEMKKGMNVLRLSINSKNPKAEGFRTGVDCVKLEADG